MSSTSTEQDEGVSFLRIVMPTSPLSNFRYPLAKQAGPQSLPEINPSPGLIFYFLTHAPLSYNFHLNLTDFF